MEPKKKLLIGGMIGAALAVLYGPAFVRWMELQARRDHLRAEVAYLQRENQRLYRETQRLREDPAYAEAVARREYGFVRPGETVIKFQKKSSER
ncbi:MAG: septum formation initiator family protein [Candidatus Omnitrophica bacterium]|nr:septum formation initiator family protein [Candidatus Omnitrophota bacterium]